MPDVPLNCALHHCASIVVLDEAFPSGLGKIVVLSESLLAEVFDSIVVCIGQKVVQFFRLRVILQLVHESRAVTLDLLLCRDGQEDYLSELLRVEGPKDAAAQDLRLLALLSLDNDHGFMHAIHH